MRHFTVSMLLVIAINGACEVTAGGLRPAKRALPSLSHQERMELEVSLLSQEFAGTKIALGGELTDGISSERDSSSSTGDSAHAARVWVLLSIQPEMGEVTPDTTGILARFVFRSDAPNDKGSHEVLAITGTVPFSRRVQHWSTGMGDANPNRLLSLLAKTSEDEAGILSNSFKASPTASSGSFDPLSSDSVLLEKELHDGTAVFSRNESRRLFNGMDIISVPWGVCASIDDALPLRAHDYVGVTDWSWSRIVAADGNEPERVAAFGSNGSGLGQFNRPMGMACGSFLWSDAQGAPSTFWIADAGNNRIVRGSVYAQPNHPNDRADSIHFDHQYTNNFKYPTDVDAAGQELIIADNGNNQVVRISNVTVIHRLGPSSGGTGEMEFRHPSSVRFARNLSGYQIDTVFYVADNGNQRVVLIVETPLSPSGFFWRELPLYGTDIVALEVDNFGNVYALDANSGQLFKFDGNLTPLAVYKFRLPDGSLVIPRDFAVTHGQIGTLVSPPSGWEYEPAQSGDAFLTTSFGPTTGVNRFQLGTEVLLPSVTFAPRNELNPDTAYVFISFHLTDAASQVTINGRLGGIVSIFDEVLGAQVAGRHTIVIPLDTNSTLEGECIVEITATSLYPGSNEHTVTTSVEIDNSIVNSLPTITYGPVPVCDPCGSCIPDGAIRYFRVEASDTDGEIVKYVWHAGYQGLFIDNLRDTITTLVPEVICQIDIPLSEHSTTNSDGMEPAAEEEPGALWVFAYDDRGARSDTAIFPVEEVCGVVCNCDCHADPDCDSVVSVLDVVAVVNVAFRNTMATFDIGCWHNGGPSAGRTDVNCDNVTDLDDVGLIIAVAFDGGNPAALLCSPCGPYTVLAGTEPSRRTRTAQEKRAVGVITSSKR